MPRLPDREGDALVVPSLDRYGRSLKGLVTMVAELRELRASRVPCQLEGSTS
ncbi:recombinase family protein [Streptomyces atratus]|uniref:recombinase family protein n=1 Tax=Streptomyces atratus TaxID=1893 RepID=UPI0036BE35F8